MCGFLTAFYKQKIPLVGLQSGLDRMIHRGPDAAGVWESPSAYLGHRRLAIMDLDQRATQPMLSACGRYRIVFNGEIYNFRSLRDNLKNQGVVFRTTSDTEVILEGFARAGLDLLPQLQGMFAFVIWDQQKTEGLRLATRMESNPCTMGISKLESFLHRRSKRSSIQGW